MLLPLSSSAPGLTRQTTVSLLVRVPIDQCDQCSAVARPCVHMTANGDAEPVNAMARDADGVIIEQGLRRSASDGALAALGRSFVDLVRSPSQKSFTKDAEASSSTDDV